MATNDSLKAALAQQPKSQLPAEQNSVKNLMASPVIQNKFKALLREKSAGFTSSVITLVNSDKLLAEAAPMSVISGAMQAAQLDLPLEKQFGFAYLVPFGERDKRTGAWIKKAQFILGYRGYIQLAQRSGQYRNINVITVYEGQLKGWNPLTEEVDYDPDGKISDKAVAYIGRFELLNGFVKQTLWTKEQVEAHRIKHNKNKDKQKLAGVWASDYDAMAQKTVLRSLLSKWGILSIEMQRASIADEQIIDDFDDDGTPIIDVTESGEEEPATEDPTETIMSPEEMAEAMENIKVDEVTGEIIEQEQLFPTGVKSKLPDK
ncbi:recombinase RecT [Vaginisenegalia massiliensis]|uniref:recombinase RecT n=1 Tax=Vaginisenegalia massiliensis TaxID=2058294 RepID=UPI000F52324C|nr:recombinase RecT [Vaginisenegalia massiliensis]